MVLLFTLYSVVGILQTQVLDYEKYTVSINVPYTSNLMPVFMCFHGAMGNIDNCQKLDRDVFMLQNFVTVFPVSKTGFWENTKNELKFLKTIVKNVTQHSNIAQRVVCAGYSQGSYIMQRLFVESKLNVIKGGFAFLTQLPFSIFYDNNFHKIKGKIVKPQPRDIVYILGMLDTVAQNEFSVPTPPYWIPELLEIGPVPIYDQVYKVSDSAYIWQNMWGDTEYKPLEVDSYGNHRVMYANVQASVIAGMQHNVGTHIDVIREYLLESDLLCFVDVNRDGRVDILDGVEALRYLSTQIRLPNFCSFDANTDGQVDMADVELIFDHIIFTIPR